MSFIGLSKLGFDTIQAHNICIYRELSKNLTKLCVLSLFEGLYGYL